MYPKNTASPRRIYAKVVSAADGSPLTADVVAYHIQADTRGAVGGTAAAHIANGLWGYTPTQAETNYDAFAVEFYHADAVGEGPIVEIVTTDTALFASAIWTASIAAYGFGSGEMGYALNQAYLGINAIDTGDIKVMLANDAITALVIATGAIDADAIAANAITADKIASNAITAAKINADAITSDKIADDAIGNEHWNVTAVTGCVLGNTAHGGAGASLTLSDYSDFTGATATNPNVLLTAEIAEVSDQTHFTLATGSDQDDAYNDQAIALYDDSNSDYPCVRVVVDYTGATKTVQIDSAPVFTLGENDSVNIFATAPGTTAPTAAQVADAVWDETSTGHTDATKAGARLWTDIPAILEDTGTTIPATLQTIDDYVDCLPASWVTVPTVAQIWTTQLTESYSTVTVAPTASQALFELLAMRNTQIVDTTRTAYKLDGTTAAMTLALTMDTDNKPYKQSRSS